MPLTDEQKRRMMEMQERFVEVIGEAVQTELENSEDGSGASNAMISALGLIIGKGLMSMYVHRGNKNIDLEESTKLERAIAQAAVNAGVQLILKSGLCNCDECQRRRAAFNNN